MTSKPSTPSQTSAPRTGTTIALNPGWPEHAPGQGVGEGSGTPGPTPLSPEQHAALRSRVSSMLAAGVHGLCFSPYLDGQGPGDQVTDQQIRDRLQVIRPHTRWIRSFSCTDGNERIPAIAHQMGLKTLVGAWLGTDPQINAREIAGAIALARDGHVDLLAIGNEVLLREDLEEDSLIACIEEVRQALPGVQIGYVDAYYLFEKHPRVTAACDVIMTNCYPFWEGCPREQAVEYMQSMVRRVQAAAPGKRIIISETGWPDRGSAFHGAVPSTDGAMRYFVDTFDWAQREGLELFYFSAFDEAWKVGTEGDVGAYWGLWDKDGQPKFSE
jgi:glucan 1,3-beta-glucosidase